jgi:hypothetical protein
VQSLGHEHGVVKSVFETQLSGTFALTESAYAQHVSARALVAVRTSIEPQRTALQSSFDMAGLPLVDNAAYPTCVVRRPIKTCRRGFS